CIPVGLARPVRRTAAPAGTAVGEGLARLGRGPRMADRGRAGPQRRDRAVARLAGGAGRRGGGRAAMNLSILYRGTPASCNYDCPYCPFAKRRDDPAALRSDRAALERFVQWAAANPDGHRLSILFTPWGEGLTRRWYRDALVRLSHLSHVDRVAIQT